MKTNTVFFVLIFLFIGSFLCESCKKKDDNGEEDVQPCSGTPTVTYEGQVYNTVGIGNQCWMKENLNYETGNSWCYDNNPVNCIIYGRLYDWATIMNGSSSSNSVPRGVQGICPPGWHIPGSIEWVILINYLGGNTIAGGAMKETGIAHWQSPNEWSTNISGFSGLPGGCFSGNTNKFNSLRRLGFFWSSTEFNSNESCQMWLYVVDEISYYDYDSKEDGLSIRCLKN